MTASFFYSLENYGGVKLLFVACYCGVEFEVVEVMLEICRKTRIDNINNIVWACMELNGAWKLLNKEFGNERSSVR